MNKPSLGFIGLGNMGEPMAINLCRNNQKVYCFDKRKLTNKLPENGIIVSAINDISKNSEVVFLCLPDGSVVLNVINEIINQQESKIQIIVDNTTSGVADAKKAWELCKNKEIQYVDAPVSGGVTGAKAGSLSMMVAAPRDVYEFLEPLIISMAKNARNVGSHPGQGMAMKLLNNYLSGMAMAASSEAVEFGVKQGLDPAKIIEVLNISTGRNSSTEDKFPKRILTESFDSGFATALMAKDLKLYVESAQNADSPIFLSKNLLDGIWNNMYKEWPDSDFTKIYPYIKKYGV